MDGIYLIVQLERCSFECRKNKTKVIIIIITLTNHNTGKQRNMNQSEIEANACNRCQAQENACSQVMIGLGFISFSLVRKVVRVMLTNHRAQESKTKAITKLLLLYFRRSIENRSIMWISPNW